MNGFIKKVDNIFQLKIPFDTVYTSVFLVSLGDGYLLVDTGASGCDVVEYIIPALQDFGVSLAQLKYILLTHCHGDHSGGLEELKRHYPNAKIIDKKTDFVKPLEIVCMAGHTSDCIGVLDLRTKTLITGDAIQGDGVDKFRATIQDENEYYLTLKNLLNDERVENLLFSHAYEPWEKDCILGRHYVCQCAKTCLDNIRKE